MLATLKQLTTAPNPIVADTLEHLRDTASIALALAGSPGVLAIETFKMLNSLTTPTIPDRVSATPKAPNYPPSPQAAKKLTPAQQWAKDDRDIFDGFLANLRIALDEGLLDGSMKADVSHQGHKYIAIHLLSVLGALESRLDYRPHTTDLQRAIVKHGGKVGQVQRFEPKSPASRNGHRSISRKCIVIPTAMI